MASYKAWLDLAMAVYPDGFAFWPGGGCSPSYPSWLSGAFGPGCATNSAEETAIFSFFSQPAFSEHLLWACVGSPIKGPIRP